MTTKPTYKTRYTAELRYFDELDDDYVHLQFQGRTSTSAFKQALHYHNTNFKNDKAKINIFYNKHPEHETWCIESKTISG